MLLASEVYTTAEWERARLDALERDGFRCTAVEGYDWVENDDGEWVEVEIRCTETLELHVHHLERPEDGGEPFALSNLLTLCASHHAKLHALQREHETATLERDLIRRLRGIVADTPAVISVAA